MLLHDRLGCHQLRFLGRVGVVSQDAAVIADCQAYFDGLWRRGGPDLQREQVDDWERTVSVHHASGGRSKDVSDLGDFGTNAGFAEPPPVSLPAAIADAGQAFVKIIGDNPAPLSLSTIAEIKGGGCYRILAYPTNGRPRGVKDGAVMFIGRKVGGPNDIRIFGRAIGMEYKEKRDDATPGEKALNPDFERWSRYIRVHHAEFVSGTMENGVSLNALMDKLEADSFASTQRNAQEGKRKNTNPRKAYRRHPAVKLSGEGLFWLNEQLQAEFDTHGKISQDTLNKMDWPELPSLNNDG